MLRAAFLVALLTLHSGCSTSPNEPIAPTQTTAFLAARASAKPCETPRRPAIADGRSFKYGCFCGKSYPAYGPETTPELASLSAEEIDALVQRYYALKPYDDLDAACQAHDICYLINRGARRSCDETFASHMLRLWSAFRNESVQRWRNPSAGPHINPMAPRCSDIAMHLTLAQYFFEGTSQSPGYELSSGVINLVFGGIAVGLASTTILLTTYPDPATGERCDVTQNFASRLPGAVLDP